jgi:hypothetical protein
MTACRVKPFLLSWCSTWKVLTPFHSSFSPSIRGSKNTSKSFPREVGPEISRDIKQFDGFTHSHGGRFKGVTRTVHILYVELKLPNWLKPSVVMASLKFLGSSAKVLCFLSKCYHASPSTRWLISLVFFSRLVLCHLASAVVPQAAKILYNLSIRGKCLKILWETRLLPFASSHLDCLHFRHACNSSLSPQNNTHLFLHTWILS